MKMEEIFKLLDAGYTKDEIKAMEEEKEPEGKPEPEVKPDESKKPESNTDSEILKLIKDLQDNNEKMRVAIEGLQESNVKGAKQPERTETAESVIASFLEG